MLTYVLTFLAGAAAVVVFEFAWLNQLLAPPPVEQLSDLE